jgi:N-acylneuraminate cytidylyltransferase/CMP-N,N'-diacetyllegionaminic acid synthase
MGFIPARAGSKGVPGKNIKTLAGKPLITYTIEAALASGVFDYLIVSTDSEDIARTARGAGAETPFLRPVELATDMARGMDALQHTMAWCEEQDKHFDWLMNLQPTSPLRSLKDIINACELMIQHHARAVVSVCEVDHHPWWSNTLPGDHCMEHFIRPEILNTNRQNLPKYYRLNGAIYLAEWDFLRQRKTWYGKNTYAYIMPQERSADIDTDLDFAWAELLLSKNPLRI